MLTYSILKPIVALLALTGCHCAGSSRKADAETSSSYPLDAGNPDAGGSPREVATLKLRIITRDAVLTATLDDNAAARDFVSLLPLRLTLRDYAGTEKIGDLPRRLSTSGTPPGVDPGVGDLAYYAPWGNLAIYYRDFGYSTGLVKLGHIESGIEKLADSRGEFVVRFELEQGP